MSGFRVHIDTLRAAGEAISTVVQELRAHPVRDIDCAAAAFGHPRLARTVRDFCHRWQAGVQHLATDGEQIGQLLTETAQQYQQADAAATKALLDATGEPATGPAGSVGSAVGQEVL
jgi:hypothetical protein